MKEKYLMLFLLLATSPILAASDFIEGKVVNASGRPEAGVWVVAETDQLPTDYRKIVVTDDAGNFLLPELPKANYEVWVRGYGLRDSKRISAKPGGTVNFQVENAKNPMEAARIYPAVYWMSMIDAPSQKTIDESSHPYPSPAEWLYQFKLNCTYCHQLGSALTRLPVAQLYDHGLKKAGTMNDVAKQLDRDVLLDVLGNWANRLAAGETPSEHPPRPTGVEQNFVITQWGWGNQYTYAHDEIATDKRNPRLYPYGPIYGVDIGTDYLLELDPVTHTAGATKLPSYENAQPWCDQTYKPLGGDEIFSVGAKLLGCPEPGVQTQHLGAYPNPANPHNPMMDDKGRVWMTMQVRREWGEDLPEFCKKTPVIANNLHHRQIGYYDTKTKKTVQIDSCFGTHHLQFDDNDVLWFSGDGHVVGWLDTKKFDADDPASLEAAMGWSEGKIDTDGDGIADEAVVGFRYGILPNPVDGSIWVGMPPGGLYPADGPGSIQRYDPTSDTHEIYMPPAPGFGPRGVEVDSKGMTWTALAGSGHLARFDRSRCKQTWGTGDQCPEGWTLWDIPGPQFAAIKKGDNGDNNGTADKQYYIWIDTFNTLGMGEDTIIVNGTASDSLIAFRPDTQEFTVIRIPYPLVTYTRGLDGRIDDDKAGWKGRGLWFTNGLDPVYHSEIPKSYVGHVQLRPDPLAK